MLVPDGPSLWQHLAQTAPTTQSFAGRADVEIAIVGGGVAGLSLALHLAAAGKTPLLLEADRFGSGALGASAGIVAPQLVPRRRDSSRNVSAVNAVSDCCN